MGRLDSTSTVMHFFPKTFTDLFKGYPETMVAGMKEEIRQKKTAKINYLQYWNNRQYSSAHKAYKTTHSSSN
jgi:hypothetical protein